MKNIEDINKAALKKIVSAKKITNFDTGDTIKVGVKISEGKRERIQFFEGVCIAKKNRDINSSFTVRKISFGEGVERTFALYSPIVDSIKVIRSGKVRRAKLYYLRDRKGKSARIAEKIKKKIGIDVSAIIIDIHCEATSEKMAVGHEFDGKSSLIVGTHTHIPTADSRILENGTAYISDLGMCGDYNSIIGMDKNKALERFKKKIPVKGINPSTGEATLSSVLVEVDDRTGLAKSIQQIIIGGSLKEIM